MKKINSIQVASLLFLSSILSSCEAIAGIFKAGMGFGIFIVVAVIVLVIVLILKAGGNKS